MTRSQIVQTAVLTGVILAIVVVLDYFVNVVAMPGVTPYTPLATAAITLLVTPAAIAYLVLQNAKVQSANMALAEERVARLAGQVVRARGAGLRRRQVPERGLGEILHGGGRVGGIVPVPQGLLRVAQAALQVDHLSAALSGLLVQHVGVPVEVAVHPCAQREELGQVAGGAVVRAAGGGQAGLVQRDGVRGVLQGSLQELVLVGAPLPAGVDDTLVFEARTPRQLVLRRSVEVGSTYEGRVYVPFFLNNVGCAPVSITVTLGSGSSRRSRSAAIPFRCGE